MIKHVFDRSRKVSAEVLAAAEHVRELGRQAAPGGWEARSGALIDHSDQPFATLTGPWASGTASYLTTFAPYTGFKVAELLWRSENAIRSRTLPTGVRDAVLALAHEINSQRGQPD
jgi:hypothetical protein